MNKKLFFIILSCLIFPVAFASGQNSGAGLPSAVSAPTSAATSTASPLVTTTTPSTATPIKPKNTTPSAITKKPVSSKILTVPSALPKITPKNNTAPVKNVPANNAGFIAIVSAIALGIIGIFSSQFIRKNNVDKKQKQGCENIKGLIEQKKEELAEIVKYKAVEKLAGDGTIGKVVDLAEDVQDNYERLQKIIAVLQKRYDLCILSLPDAGGFSYKGKIIENSLNDKAILENLKITKNYKIQDWLINEVAVNGKQIEKLGEYLNDGPWCMHFWKEKGDEIIVVFKDKIFRMKASNKNTWKDAIEYGRSRGLSKKQLDFEAK